MVGSNLANLSVISCVLIARFAPLASDLRIVATVDAHGLFRLGYQVSIFGLFVHFPFP